MNGGLKERVMKTCKKGGDRLEGEDYRDGGEGDGGAKGARTQ